MCFHNSMSKKAQQVAARYGRKSDIVEIYQDILNEQYHVNAFNFLHNSEHPHPVFLSKLVAFNS